MNSVYTLSCKHLSIFLPSASAANRSSCNDSSSLLHSASSVCLSSCNVPRTDSRQISAKIQISRRVRHTAFREAGFTQLSASVWHVATLQELTMDRIEPKFSNISPLHDAFHCDMTHLKESCRYIWIYSQHICIYSQKWAHYMTHFIATWLPCEWVMVHTYVFIHIYICHM